MFSRDCQSYHPVLSITIRGSDGQAHHVYHLSRLFCRKESFTCCHTMNFPQKFPPVPSGKLYCPLVISVQEEMIAALDRWISFLRNHLKPAELAAKYIHRCGKAFTLNLPPTSGASRCFFGVSQGSAAYIEMARVRLWPESHNLARTVSLHRKTALQRLAGVVCVARPHIGAPGADFDANAFCAR